MTGEEVLDTESLEEAIEDRQGADPAGVEGASLGMGDLAGAWVAGGGWDMTSLGLFHRCGS
jgi:hypothetical protein